MANGTTDSTDTTAQPDAFAQAMAIANAIRGQQQSYAPSAPVDRSTASLLGEALGGGTTGLAPADREAAGTRALLNFGLNMLAGSGYSTMPRTFGQVFAQGAGGAEQSLAGSEQVAYSRLAAQQAYQEKQQELRISALREAIPLLQMVGTAARGTGLIAGVKPAGTSIGAAGADVPPGAYGTGGPAADAKVPAEWMPYYQEAAARTGIPVDVLIAQARQESGFNADATGKAGEIGVHQIMPSTATNPGFGLAPVDPATLKDPRANINFAADYLKAHLPPGTAPTDPAALRVALQGYNGGGDPNYVAHVTRYLPPPTPQQAAGGAQPPAPYKVASTSPTAPAPSAPPAAARPGGTPVAAAPAGFPVGPGAQAGAQPGVLPSGPPQQLIYPELGAAGAAAASAIPVAAAPPPQVSAAQPAPTPTVAQQQPPGRPGRVPDTFTPVRVPLPPDVQNRIDHPETPAIAEAYRNAVSGPGVTIEQQNAAIEARKTAIEKNRAEATTQGEAIQTQAATQQQETWKTLRAEQQANDAAAATRQQERDMELLRNNDAQVNETRKNIQTADNTRLTAMRTDAEGAQSNINTIQILQALNKNMPATGSALLNAYPSLLNVLPNIDLNKETAAGLNGQDLFMRMVNYLGTTLSQKPAGAGTARGAEIDQNMGVLPNLAQDQAGRAQLLGFLQNVQQFRVNRANAAEDFYNNNYHPDSGPAGTKGALGPGVHTLFHFDRDFEDGGPSIIPQVGPNAPIDPKVIKPGMVYRAPVPVPVPGGDPKKGPFQLRPDGTPVYRQELRVRGG